MPNIKVSYESYRCIFNNEFNVSFGYPRTDTFSTCDSIIAKLAHIESQLRDPNNAANEKLRSDEKKITEQQQLHLGKSEVFYDRKRNARKKATTNNQFAALAFDFQKNLYVPNKTTNDVYYKWQLSCYSFNIHVLSSREAHFYCYDETVAKKGSDDVASMLYHFFMNELSETVKDIALFCDSCSGQNKNWTVIRFCHWLVNKQKRFNSITISFPIRGHSYLECDKNMSLIKAKTDAEIPSEWWSVFRAARENPSPFIVHECKQNDFFNFSALLKPSYKRNCPFPTRPVREIWFDSENPKNIRKRTNWNGFWENVCLVNANNWLKALAQNIPPLYVEPLPISKANFEDLQVLKIFCSPSAQIYFDNLSKAEHADDGSDEEYCD